MKRITLLLLVATMLSACAFGQEFPSSDVFILPPHRLCFGRGDNGHAVCFTATGDDTASLTGTITGISGGSGTPGGSVNQVQYQVNGTTFGGFTFSGDCTVVVATGVITCTKTGGVSFAASATTDTTQAGNISGGTLGCGRLPAFTGDATTSIGTCGFTVSKLNGTAFPTSASLISSNGSAQPVAATAHNVAVPQVCADSSGSGTAQSCTTVPSFTPAANDCIVYTTTTANTGAGLTLNVNAQGAKSVAKWQGVTSLSANDVLANKSVDACYDGTNWEIATVGNAPAGSGANTALSNLASPAINLALSPGTDNSISLDDLTHRYINEWLSGVAGWTNGSGTADTGISRGAAGEVDFGNGAAADKTATIKAATGVFSSGLATGSASVPAFNGFTFPPITAPGTPSAGTDDLYTDGTDLRFHDKNSAGTIGTTVVANTLAAHNFANAISAAGVVSGAQPGFSDLSGSATNAQLPAITLDKSATGLANPTADATFTEPASSTSGITLAGTAPASGGANGTAATTLFNVNGVIGGATSSTTANTGGTGSAPSISGGAGGQATGAGGTTTVGGVGGSVSLIAGAGGAGSAGNDSGGAGGNIVLTPGAGGSKTGTGTAGATGSVNIAVGSLNLGTAPVITTPGTGFPIYGTEGTEPGGIASGTDAFVDDSTLHCPVVWNNAVEGGCTDYNPIALTGTNTAGTDHVISAGLGTGNAAVSHVKIQSPALSQTSGTTAQTQVTRFVVHAKAGSTTSATATNMFQVVLASNQTAGVMVNVHVETTQATPHNCSTDEVFVASVQNTGGTVTQQTTAGTIGTICDTGTLTIAAAFSAATTSVFSVTPSWTTVVPTAVTITITVINGSQEDISLL